MKNIEIEIENVKCGGCAHSITDAALKEAGVHKANVDLDAEKLLLETDDSFDKSNLVVALDKMGYPEKGHNTILKTAKSYVSCAVGKMKQ